MKSYKLYILLLFIISACGSSKNATDQPIEVSVSITSTSDYCGGIAPKEKLLEQLKTPKSYVNKDIFISRDNVASDNMTKLSTNDKGELVTSLTVGTYYVYIPAQLYTELAAEGNDVGCKKYKSQPRGTFNVEKGIENISLNIHLPCDPCKPPRM